MVIGTCVGVGRERERRKGGSGRESEERSEGARESEGGRVIREEWREEGASTSIRAVHHRAPSTKMIGSSSNCVAAPLPSFLW